MRKIRIPLWIISMTTLSITLFILIKRDKKLPSPTDIVYEKEGNTLDREKWIKEMHQAAPGFNWRLADQQYRLERANRMRVQQRSSSVSFANGALKGHWYETGSVNQAGRIHLSAYDPVAKELLTASAGGNIWIGNLNGNSWKIINDHFKIPNIIALKVVYINNTRRIIAISGASAIEGVFYTDDEGNSWQVSGGLSGIARWGNIFRVVCTHGTPGNIFFLAQEWDYSNWGKIITLYKSEDQGYSFKQIRSFSSSQYGSANYFDLWGNENYSTFPYLMVKDSFFTLLPNDDLQHLGNGSFTVDGTISLAGFESFSTKVFYVVVKHSSSSSVYRSSNGGLSWQYVSEVQEKPFRKTSFTCSASNPDNLYLGGVNCYRSHDGGATWQKVNNWYSYYGDPDGQLHADIPAINSIVINKIEHVLINTDGGTYLSTDSLLTVKNLSLLNHNVSQYYSVYTCRFETDVIHAGAQDQGYQKSTSTTGIRSFKQVISGDYGHIVSGDEGASIWMVYPGFAIYYPNINGSTSSKRWDFDMSGNYWIPPLMEDPDDETKVYLAGGSKTAGSKIFHLSYYPSGIVAEEETYNFSSGGSKISAMAYSPLNTDIRFVLTNKGDFYWSDDAGNQWTKQTKVADFGAHYFYGNDILASTKDTGTLYIAGSGYSNPGVYVSHDYGKSFTALDSNLPATLFFKLETDEEEKYLFAATETGAYVYVLEAGKWFDLAAGAAPDQNYWSVDYVPAIHTARFGTYGRGIWDFVLCDSAESWVTASFSMKTSGLHVDLVNQSSGADSFYWDFGDGTFSSALNPSHTFSAKGNYKVKLYASGSCFSDSISQKVIVYPLSLVDLAGAPAVSVFPNPSDGHFLLQVDKPSAKNMTVNIMNLRGESIWQEKTTGGKGKITREINAGEISSGHYLLRVECGDKVKTLPLLIIK